MSTTDLGRLPAGGSLEMRDKVAPSDTWGVVRSAMMPLASLRLTVVLFALSILLVLAGTLVQVEHDEWFAIYNYFRCWLAVIEIKIFFPTSWQVPGSFPFPGGWLLGTALGINLLAAHMLRFKVTGKGRRLHLGNGLIAAGALLTYIVVQSGLGGGSGSELSPQFNNGLWHALRFMLGMCALGLVYWLVFSYSQSKQSGAMWLWWLGAIGSVLLGALALWLFAHPDAQLDASGLRILWQLIKGTVAGLVLYAGCHLVFGRRAGIVLLHSGIALIMFNELFTGLYADEAHMRLVVDQTLDYAEDIRSVELAVIDKSDPAEDAVTVIPGSMLQKAYKNKTSLEHPSLPFSIDVVEFFENSELRSRQPGEETPATQGVGLLKIAHRRSVATGVDRDRKVDIPAAYIQLQTQADLDVSGTYLVSPLYTESLIIQGKPYEIVLRFRRLHKDYSVTLVEFVRNTYVGTEKPKNFESVVRLKDPKHNVDRVHKIWMNNPLRYRGDTLYQSGFDPDNENYTDLQVMTNSGWMVPYVACMIVGIGMLAHFLGILRRFLRRQEEAFAMNRNGETQAANAEPINKNSRGWMQPIFLVPAFIVLCSVLYVAKAARPVQEEADQFRIHQFGELPVASGGRVLPMDTLARNTLQALSAKQTFKDKADVSQPAIRWFLDALTQKEGWKDHRVFRIVNLEVLQTLALEPRSGFLYSFNELGKQAEEFDRQIRLARKDSREEKVLQLAQKKFLELSTKVNTLLVLMDVFSHLAINGETPEKIIASLRVAQEKVAFLDKNAAHPLPPNAPGEAWQSVMAAELHGLYADIPAIAPKKKSKPGDSEQKKWEKNAASPAMTAMLNAYRESNRKDFNEHLAAYQEIIEKRAETEANYDQQLGGESSLKPAERMDLRRVSFEAYYNHLSPFYLAMVFYVGAFILVALSWLHWTATLNRSAHWLLWFTFALHTFALVSRIYISGRPPVTNLYSSAIFIGWAAVLFALIFERIYQFGVGNLLAAIIGFPTLFIAHNLAADGDTFEVLQAVLDTQFWLTTHVVCITLGYSTTFLAGFLGVVYIGKTYFVTGTDENERQQLVRMIYGTLCFATLFSFIGTVLGGLWADDSWGRFWGWDTKENGALMIVLWNALVLHARWGAMVRHRGFAVLAIFGNVVTAWSWFGVNLLGVGLHTYGHTEGRTKWVVMFAVSQLAVMLLGSMTQQKKSDHETQSV